jgi:spore coat protein U-like protein
MIKRFLLNVAMWFALVGMSGFALATTTTANLAVTATVSQNCSITATALAFGGYDPVVTNATAALNASSTISVACTQGASGVTVGMGQGTHYSSSNRMEGITHSGYLSYTIYHPPSAVAGTVCTFPGTTAWTTTGTGLLTLTSPTSKAARTYYVCGTIGGGQDVPVDSYSDTVIVTVTF